MHGKNPISAELNGDSGQLGHCTCCSTLDWSSGSYTDLHSFDDVFLEKKTQLASFQFDKNPKPNSTADSFPPVLQDLLVEIVQLYYAKHGPRNIVIFIDSSKSEKKNSGWILIGNINPAFISQFSWRRKIQLVALI